MSRWHDRSTSVGGVDAHYIEARPDGAGDVETIVLIHGGGVSSCAELNYGAAMEHLGRTHHVIAPDVVGYGLTPGRSDADFTEEAQGQFVVDFVASLGRRVHLGGNSAGGWLAMYATLRAPELIKTLNIINSGSVVVAERTDDDASRYDPRWAVPDAPPSLDDVRRQLEAFYVDERIVTPERIRRTHEIAHRNYDFARRRQQAMGATSADRNRRLQVDGRHISAYAEELRLPVLMTWSRENRAGSPEAALAFFNRLRHGELSVFVDAGHHVQTEHPERWSEIVAGFVRAHRSA